MGLPTMYYLSDYFKKTPSINYYNSNVNMDLYKDSKVSNWSLKNETLMYLEKDILSLLGVLETFLEVYGKITILN